MNKTQNNEWILSKPAPTGSEQWRFVRVGNKIKLYHTLENGEEYDWGDSMSMELGRESWRTMVQNGFVVCEKIAEAGKNGNN